MKTKQWGMTLIELMIVIAIIAIIGMVAFPSYLASIKKARATDGVAMIHKVMQAQERYFVTNLGYTTDLTDLGFGDDNNLPSEESFYSVSALDCGSTGTPPIIFCINISAVAQGPQATEGNLSLNNQGTKTGKWPNDY